MDGAHTLLTTLTLRSSRPHKRLKTAQYGQKGKVCRYDTEGNAGDNSGSSCRTAG